MSELQVRALRYALLKACSETEDGLVGEPATDESRGSGVEAVAVATAAGVVAAAFSGVLRAAGGGVVGVAGGEGGAGEAIGGGGGRGAASRSRGTAVGLGGCVGVGRGVERGVRSGVGGTGSEMALSGVARFSLVIGECFITSLVTFRSVAR